MLILKAGLRQLKHLKTTRYYYRATRQQVKKFSKVQ